MKFSYLFTLFALLTPLAHAEPQRFLKMGDLVFDDHQRIQYQCSKGERFYVDYWNSSASGQGIALLPIEGQTNLFVTVLSGSGAKYQSGQWTWWSKGNQAELYDAMSAAPPKKVDGESVLGVCREKEDKPQGSKP